MTDENGLPFIQVATKSGRFEADSKDNGNTKSDEKRAYSEEKEDDNGTDGEEEARDPRGIWRGDSPPRKKPSRKEGDDEDGAGNRELILSSWSMGPSNNRRERTGHPGAAAIGAAIQFVMDTCSVEE